MINSISVPLTGRHYNNLFKPLHFTSLTTELTLSPSTHTIPSFPYLTNYQLPIPCKGIGTIITKTPHSPQPIILTLVYFSQSTTVSILSLSALQQSYPHFDIQLDPTGSITFCLDNNTTYSIPIFNQDSLPYTLLPVYYLCNQDIFNDDENGHALLCTDDDDSPTIASLTATLQMNPSNLPPVINTNGHVNINTIDVLQRSILKTHPPSSFRTHRTAIFHLDSGANVHATNNYSDFILFNKIDLEIHLAASSTVQCKGIGAILV